MTTKDTDTPKNKALQQFCDSIEIKPPEPLWVAGTWRGKFRRKSKDLEDYDQKAMEAIKIWNTYPDCSEPPVGNSDPLAGLRGLLVWAKNEQKENRGTSATRTNKSKSTGRGQKYSDDVIKRAMELHDDEYEKAQDYKAAWDKTAKIYGFPNGEAARRIVTRRMKTIVK